MRPVFTTVEKSIAIGHLQVRHRQREVTFKCHMLISECDCVGCDNYVIIMTKYVSTATSNDSQTGQTDSDTPKSQIYTNHFYN